MIILKKIGIALLMVSCVVAYDGVAIAEHMSETGGKRIHLKKRLMDKYKEIGEVTSTLQETPHGPSGKLYIHGEMAPDEVPVVEGEHAWERGMAKGFLKQEAAMFGITDMDEIQERLVSSSIGYYGEITHVHFHRIINGLVLENSYFHITVDAIRNISSVSAGVVPSPPELYEATKKPTLSEDKIIKIIEENLKTSKSKPNFKLNKLEKLAIHAAPYVIWSVDVILIDKLGRWKYRIDAFSGEILEKKYALINTTRSIK